MKKFAIIVAGGTGSRFGATIPKQFIVLCSKPLLMHSIETFHRVDADINIIVVLPGEHLSLWSDLCKQYCFTIPHTVAEGGDSRFASVKNALQTIPAAEGLVAVHDGARPLLTEQMVRDGFATAEQCGTAVPVIPVTDSIRMLDREGSHALNRESLVAVQTPQVFSLNLLKHAYATPFSPLFTDDASVVEHNGTPITLYKGNVRNIKITHPGDIRTAEALFIGNGEA